LTALGFAVLKLTIRWIDGWMCEGCGWKNGWMTGWVERQKPSLKYPIRLKGSSCGFLHIKYLCCFYRVLLLAGSEYEELSHGWGELDYDAARTDEATSRLALCHMDWDRIRASDLMVLFSSFLPQGGLIHSVTVCVLFVRCITSFIKVINAGGRDGQIM
jgi:hypothetical protein